MKKDERQLLIREIIQHEKLSTQKDIQDRLDQRGAGVTQTTLSRDLREIGLIKVKEKGDLYYKLADEPDRTDILDDDLSAKDSATGLLQRNGKWETM